MVHEKDDMAVIETRILGLRRGLWVGVICSYLHAYVDDIAILIDEIRHNYNQPTTLVLPVTHFC